MNESGDRMNAVAEITENGQMTIPPEIRQYLGLKAGDAVRFASNADGEIVISNVSQIPQNQAEKQVRALARNASFAEIQEYLDCYKKSLTSRFPDKQMLLVFSYNDGNDYKIKFIRTTPEEFLRAEYFTITEKSTASGIQEKMRLKSTSSAGRMSEPEKTNSLLS